MMDIQTGDIICAKSITHRIPVELVESKSGKQKARCNEFGYRFQIDVNLLSTVGVFLFLGIYPEQMDGSVMEKWAVESLRRLGWTCEKSSEAGVPDPPSPTSQRSDP